MNEEALAYAEKEIAKFIEKHPQFGGCADFVRSGKLRIQLWVAADLFPEREWETFRNCRGEEVRVLTEILPEEMALRDEFDSNLKSGLRGIGVFPSPEEEGDDNECDPSLPN